ncbi:MAG: putative 2-aminoethylphosphonate ABC transporter permease subunit, partial [Hyphomicrobiales bacterium]|nr:putative 2-aminoethylphosphonate ABC transporter permease subunit [Hyphomicrobiales bacterium]
DRARPAGTDKGALVTIAGVIAGITALAVFVAAPLGAMFVKALQDNRGGFVGLANFRAYFGNAGLIDSVVNSFMISLAVTVMACLMAFGYAYALTRSCMPGRQVFRAIAMIPILAPSLLAAIALVYLLGNQGMIRGALFGHSVYGPIGILLGMTFYVFPHVLMIMVTALSTADARLYEAARTMGTSRWRMFLPITIPGARYGLISAAFVVFTLAITDFGIPKVIGGNYNVLATDIYKQVVGQQNFSTGAVVGLILLIPAVISFAVDRYVRRKQVSQLSARAVPFQPKPEPVRDWALFALCSAIALFLVGILATALFASLFKYWPYNLSLSLVHYDFNAIDPNGWSSFTNSLRMAAATALVGTGVIFLGAYFVEKPKNIPVPRSLLHMLAMIPMAVPGLVLGLAYVFFFSTPVNPLSFLYGSLAILVISTVAHFYTVPHLSFVTAMKQIDAEFEAVSASLKVPAYKTMWRVYVPITLPLIIDVAIYLFVNAMTTVSAAVFLYSPDTKLASIAVLNMDDVGDQAPAAAMAMMIVATSLVVKILQALATSSVLRRTSAWRSRDGA